MALKTWYRFSNEVLDASGNLNHGAKTTDTVYAEQLVDYALQLLNSSYVTIGNSINASYTAFSLAIKVRLTTTASSHGSAYYLVSLGGDPALIGLQINTSNKVVATTKIGGTTVTSTSTTSIVANQNFDIQFVYDGSTQYLYIDQTLEDSDSQSGTITLSGSDHYIGKLGSSASAPIGFVDEFRFYDEAVSQKVRTVIARFNDYYDVRIDYKSYAEQTTYASYTTAIDNVTGTFEVRLFDRTGALYDSIEDDNDVMIFQDGDIVFRGQVDLKEFKEDRRFTIIRGRDYMSILFERYAVAKKYGTFNTSDSTLRTRQYIIQNLITEYLSSSKGSIHFDTSGIEAVTTDTISREFPNTSLAEILINFANEEGAEILLEPTTTLPLTIIYRKRNSSPVQSNSADLVLDFDDKTNTTSGFVARKIQFERENRQIKNIFTVYGSASTGVGAVVRNEASIRQYGEKYAKPVTDTTVTTASEARDVAIKIQEQFENPILKGVMYANDHRFFVAGKTVIVTASSFNLTNSVFQIVEAIHSTRPKQTEMRISKVLRNNELVLADVMKKQREYDMRDADPDRTALSTFVDLTETLSMTLTFTLRRIDYDGSNTASPFYDNAIIDSGKIGQFKIGFRQTEIEATLETNTAMAISDEGLNELRDALTGNGNLLNQANLYFAFGNGSDLDDTITQATWNTTYQTQTRKQIDAEPNVGTDAQIRFSASFGDNDFTAGDSATKVAVLNASSGGQLLFYRNLSSSVTKVAGDFLVPEVTITLTDGGQS